LQKDIGASKFTSIAFSTKITELDVADTLANFERWARPRKQDTIILAGPASSYIVPQPLGVALIIAAWVN
jgi:aldehyde dehydrogenase (NAD+)